MALPKTKSGLIDLTVRANGPSFGAANCIGHTVAHIGCAFVAVPGETRDLGSFGTQLQRRGFAKMIRLRNTGLKYSRAKLLKLCGSSRKEDTVSVKNVTVDARWLRWCLRQTDTETVSVQVGKQRPDVPGKDCIILTAEKFRAVVMRFEKTAKRSIK